MNVVQEPTPEETNAPNGEVTATNTQAADGDAEADAEGEEAGDGNYSSTGLCAVHEGDANSLLALFPLNK